MEREPKATIRNGEYVLNRRGLANGGLVTGTGPSPLLGTGCDYLIPNAKQDNSMDLAQQILDKATVVHLHPDDVLVFSNIGNIDGNEAARTIKDLLPGKTIVMFAENINLDLLRDMETEQ